ncbi:unnamed protein product [Paramecium sonneborni]|uniref:Uncharacterized protein n=1 Tax=Paramecium sonneborni TaxID=65129 RepID=A0A8S1Q2V6_9CILI|nr:unnamed protein product [Paramecium sonneborni]
MIYFNYIIYEVDYIASLLILDYHRLEIKIYLLTVKEILLIKNYKMINLKIYCLRNIVTVRLNRPQSLFIYLKSLAFKLLLKVPDQKLKNNQIMILNLGNGLNQVII